MKKSDFTKLDTQTIKQAFWALVSAAVCKPYPQKDIDSFFESGTQLEKGDCTCRLCPMHRKVTTCLIHLKDWKYSPSEGIPPEGLEFIKEAYWLMANMAEAESHLYMSFYEADTQPFNNYKKLSDRLLSTDYSRLLPPVPPMVYGTFVEALHELAAHLSHLVYYATDTKQIDGVRAVVERKNFVKHVKCQQQKHAQQWDDEILQALAYDSDSDESDVVRTLIKACENSIRTNIWGAGYPLCSDDIDSFIFHLRQKSGSGNLKELIAFINLVAKRMHLMNHSTKTPQTDTLFAGVRQDIITKAVEAQLYHEEGGKLIWQNTQVLHDYFLGKLFCGDYTLQHDEGTYEWCSLPGSRLPVANLRAFFGAGAIGQARNKRPNLPDHAIIDKLFKGLQFNPTTKEWEERPLYGR